ncbi:J domain-containing protein [Pantanalinema rosaneae CENA516]|uniref:J domain-containing protein n=1 Tax=Pantanalinema rosaneae TaxID=1620701 RepID=UPI003D6EA789
MSFQIERGLFLLDFIDHHAILGIPVDAEIKDIRKRYLKIARRLHPDSCASESETDRQRASEILSKLVNPAWEKLSQEKDRSEYMLLLKLKGQQGLRQQGSVELSNLAKQLSTASNPDHFYHTSLKSLAEKQYDHLDQTLELTAQISELNLVFLMRKEGSGEAIGSSTKPIYTGSNIPDSSQSAAKPGGTAAPPPPRRESIVDQYYRRAEGHVAKNNFAQAILELREALQIEPKNSQCHALMGMVYLKQNQPKMAKIYFDKALEHDPENEMAQIGKQQLEGPTASTQAAGAKAGQAKTSSKKADPKATKSSTKPNNDKPSGGLFGLFGGKKK